MKFKPGENVIKLTGGNKMKVIQYTQSGIQCAWVSESYNEKIFKEEELILFSEYKCLLNNYRRDDIIEEILK